MPTIKLSEPTISKKAIDLVTKVLASGNLVYGEIGKSFEEKLKNYLDIEHTLLVSSGTAAIHLSLLASGIGHGDQVIVPAFTFPATANAVAMTGAKPIFLDVEPESYCLSVKEVEEYLANSKDNHRISAIIPVHEFGYPACIAKLMEVAKKHDLLIIEDAACALGASSDEKKLGTFGSTGCFSFHPRKTLTTGEGGLICTNNSEIAAKAHRLRNHGIIQTNGIIEFQEPGLNYRLSDVHSAIGVTQLEDLDDWVVMRRKLADCYTEQLKEIDGIFCPANHPGHSWQTYMVKLENDIDRDETMENLRHCGIFTNLGAQSVPRLKAYKSTHCSLKKTPIADSLYLQGLALPLCEKYDVNTVSIVTKALYKCRSKKK